MELFNKQCRFEYNQFQGFIATLLCLNLQGTPSCNVSKLSTPLSLNDDPHSMTFMLLSAEIGRKSLFS